MKDNLPQRKNIRLKYYDQYLNKVRNIYLNISIDEYIVMPNHIHIILIIHKKEKIPYQK